VRIALVLLVVACQRQDSLLDQPQADCSAVAETLTSIELGNYASKDQRAPAVAKHRQACIAAKVTQEEAACLDKATDTWSAATCVPRMFPKQASSDHGDCAEVTKRIRQSVEKDMAQAGPDAQRMLDKMLPALQASCEQDQWPPVVMQCIVAAQPGDQAAMNKCSQLMPKALQDKLQKRMMAANPGH
jgi:hypothetical protein